LATVSRALETDEIAHGLQWRAAAGHLAMVEDRFSWTYRDLVRRGIGIGTTLSTSGVRVDDRMIIVGENPTSLAGRCWGLAGAMLGRCRQSESVEARAKPDPGSQRHAQDVFRLKEGRRVSCLALWRREAAAGIIAGGRWTADRKCDRTAGEIEPSKAGRGASLLMTWTRKPPNRRHDIKGEPM
jgi:hypothetical protein